MFFYVLFLILFLKHILLDINRWIKIYTALHYISACFAQSWLLPNRKPPLQINVFCFVLDFTVVQPEFLIYELIANPLVNVGWWHFLMYQPIS